MPTLIFVYNADSGLFNTLADIGHKLISPETYRCDLCMLTHGVFKERERWRLFVAGLPTPCRFLHRDEFRREFPQVDAALPAVFLSTSQRISLGLSADQLGGCRDLDQLEGLIRDVIKDVQ
ncbi:MAG: hypothetical protein D6720_06435 [Gammaproteobacteria bacterium]|nr:MAG: hypothetical protein D6720_06435 [Gammaproteobacteria bacterium]